MRVTNLILCTMLLLFFAVPVQAVPGGGTKTEITNVFVDDPNDPTEITIVGEALLFGDNALEVTLGSYPAPLGIVGVPTNTEIVATLPVGVPSGDYQLKVSTGNGKSENDEYDLTIGGTGPQGDQGEQGKLGDVGPQGEQGKLGDAGPQGEQGKLGDVGPQGEQGKLGPAGPQGVQGKIGPQGEQGKLGPQGDQGVQGKLGPQGPVGGTGDNVVFTPSAHNNMQPYTAINYIIALQGTFPSRDSAEPLLGEIFMFAGNFAPRGFAFCNGQLLPIASYSALFSLLGTTYGGDGRTTFALPDLRGRAPIHSGNSTGPGLSSRPLGSKGGTETVTEPPHNHDHTESP
jgi:microcystin-dependent protein